jgi:FMN phosphatase YigB (HAD superfamily)
MSVIYGPPLIRPVTPDTVLCAFDLHSVLFHRDWKGIITYFFHMPHKLSVLPLILNPFFWITAYRIWQQTSVGDDIYERLVERYPRVAHFKDDFIALENMQKPDQEMIDIILKLKARGYVLYILSNIGERAFIELAKKNTTLFHLFDHCYLPQKDNGYCQKPSTAFYEDFFTFVDKKGDADKSILFIDDRAVNLEGAAHVGISGLLFTSAVDLKKSLSQLLF